jgi:uncharacterized protein YgiM (DUF1202 family)
MKKLTVLFLALVVLVLAALPAFAQEEEEVVNRTASTDFYVTAFRKVNVRSGPGTKYTVIGSLIAGDRADITGRESSRNSWMRINLDGKEGWVSFTVIRVTGDPDDAEIVEPGPDAVLRKTANQTVTDTLKVVTVVTRGNANLRANFSTSADVLVVIPAGTELTAEARTATTNWVRVTFDGKTGWVNSGGLNFTSGNTSSLPVISE